MTREDVIQRRIDEAKKEIEVIDKKIMKEAKTLSESVNLKSLDKIAEYKAAREKLYHITFELYAILGTSI